MKFLVRCATVVFVSLLARQVDAEDQFELAEHAPADCFIYLEQRGLRDANDMLRLLPANSRKNVNRATDVASFLKYERRADGVVFRDGRTAKFSILRSVAGFEAESIATLLTDALPDDVYRNGELQTFRLGDFLVAEFSHNGFPRFSCFMAVGKGKIFISSTENVIRELTADHDSAVSLASKLRTLASSNDIKVSDEKVDAWAFASVADFRKSIKEINDSSGIASLSDPTRVLGIGEIESIFLTARQESQNQMSLKIAATLKSPLEGDFELDSIDEDQKHLQFSDVSENDFALNVSGDSQFLGTVFRHLADASLVFGPSFIKWHELLNGLESDVLNDQLKAEPLSVKLLASKLKQPDQSDLPMSYWWRLVLSGIQRSDLSFSDTKEFTLAELDGKSIEIRPKERPQLFSPDAKEFAIEITEWFSKNQMRNGALATFGAVYSHSLLDDEERLVEYGYVTACGQINRESAHADLMIVRKRATDLIKKD